SVVSGGRYTSSGDSDESFFTIATAHGDGDASCTQSLTGVVVRQTATQYGYGVDCEAYADGDGTATAVPDLTASDVLTSESGYDAVFTEARSNNSDAVTHPSVTDSTLVA